MKPLRSRRWPARHSASELAFSVPAYIFASYVAISRLPANRHWLSDTVFGFTVGIIAGRTVTSHEAARPYPIAVTVIPGGAAIMYVRNR